MRYITLIWYLFIITIALYIVRPTEAFYRATIQACEAFAWEFKRIWDKEGWEALDLYRKAFDKFTDGKK